MPVASATHTPAMSLHTRAPAPSFPLTVLREEDAAHARAEFEQDVLDGLSQTPKCLCSKYFYDDAGSLIYQKITELEEYYPIRCEFEILTKHAPSLVRTHLAPFASPSRPVNLIELGAGDGRKTRVLLRECLKQGVPFEYFAVDISRMAVAELQKRMRKAFDGCDVVCHGVVGENIQALEWISGRYSGRKNLVLFLGSSLGNYTASEARGFLRDINSHLHADDELLLGLDLKKDPSIMQLAYSDPSGVTRDFNLNLLTRINRELGADFDVDQFYHLAQFNPYLGAMESLLVSKRAMAVRIGVEQRAVEFRAFEAIHMEFSHKYTAEDVPRMAGECGFEEVGRYMDERGWFVDAVWRVAGRAGRCPGGECDGWCGECREA